LPARFFAQSAVSSSSQSINLASRPRRSIKRFTIAAITPALVASDPQHIKLADQISEDDCAVAGHQ
jgi:hypothetical protein